jgi:hypothetical protein
VDQELLLRNKYLAAENRILKAQLRGGLKLSDAERATLGEIDHRLGRKTRSEVWPVAFPHFSATALMEGPYQTHSTAREVAPRGTLCYGNPAIFVAFQGAPSLAARLQVST